MKSTILFLLLSIISFSAHSQGLQLTWLDNFVDDDANSEGHSSIIDQDGNVYILGNSSGTTGNLDVNPNPGIENNTGIAGIFIAKYNAQGEYLWSVPLGQTGSQTIQLHGDIVLNNNGDVLVAGSLSGDVDFDPSAGTELASHPNGMIYLASYSTDGDLNFVHVFPLSSQGFMGIKGIDINSAGEIYFAGSIMNNGAEIASVDFDPSANEAIMTNTTGSSFFMVKYSALGDLIFLKTVTGSIGSSGNKLEDLKLDSNGDFWITGEIIGEWDMDPSSAIFSIASIISRDMFFAKYSADGDFIDAKIIYANGAIYSREIAMDADNNIYLSGEFDGAVDFDPNDAELILTSDQVNAEPYLAKYSSNGELIFALELNSDTITSGNNATRCLTTDKLGYVYIAGKIEKACDFDPSENEFTLAPLAEFDNLLYIAKYDEQGNFIWAIPFGNSTFSFVLDVDVNDAGVVTTTGLFRGTTDFDPGINQTNTVGNSLNTMFIARYNPCSYSDDVVTICQGDIYQANTRSLTEPGSYQVSYLSNTGCDSIVSLDLIVNELPSNAAGMNGDLAFFCEQSGAEYQWINCDSNEDIIGATNQSFLPTEPGIYFAEITLNNCTVYTECMTTQIVSISEISSLNWKLFPNPSSSNVYVQCNAGNKIELLTIQGKLINSQISTSGITEVTNLPKPGIYLIRVTADKLSSTTQKLILQ